MASPRLTLDFLARIVAYRQKHKESDTFIIIYGRRRTGKSTLGLQLLRRYLKVKNKQYREKKTTWKPEHRWAQHFQKYFAGDAMDMLKKIKSLPEESYVFVDEGVDVASWQHAMETEQKNLKELILKAGKRKLLTIFITPSLRLLSKDILAQAHYMLLIDSEPRDDKNVAHVLSNYDDPVLAENNPFGLYPIIKRITRAKRHVPGMLYNLISSSDSYVGSLVYKRLDTRIYELYDALVKEPLIYRQRQRTKYVSKALYDKTNYVLNTVFYNLYTKDNKSLAQLERLATDKFGNTLLSSSTIKRRINQMAEATRPDDEALSWTDEDEAGIVLPREYLESELEAISDTNESEQ